jgi:hypothetical protein
MRRAQPPAALHKSEIQLCSEDAAHDFVASDPALGKFVVGHGKVALGRLGTPMKL